MTTTISPTTDTEAPLRVGICGSGITKAHIQGYQKLPGVEVVAIAGPDVERCQAVADEYSIPHVFADYRAMLDLGLDAVSIGVPNKYHAPIAIDALAAGCHVLLEKPLAIDVADGERILRAARESGRIVMLAFNRRYLANAVTLKEFIDAGTLGDIYYAKAGWTRRAGIPGFGGWFTTKELSGGGPLIDLGVHMLDLALYMMGYPRPIAVSGATYAALGPRGKGASDYADYGRFPVGSDIVFDVEDLATGFVRFDNGATLAIEASWAGYQSLRDDIYLQLYGRDGGARIAMPDYQEADSLRLFTESAGTLVEVAPVLPKVGRGGYDHEVAIFIDSIRTGTPPPATVEQGLAVLRIIDALYRSAEAGREIVISRESGVESRESGVESRESGVESRESGVGSR